MNHQDNTPQSASSNHNWRRLWIALIGAVLAILLVAALVLQFALRKGWSTYSGLDSVNAIAVDGRGQAWAAGYLQDRVSLMTYTENGTSVEVSLPAELNQAHPITLMVDGQDRLWVGTDFGTIGMRKEDGTWILFSPENYGSDSTRQIIMDGQGRVWARSHRGPAELDPSSSERTIRYANSGLANNDAAALATDTQGKLWVLTTNREIVVHEADGTWRTVFVAPGTVRNGFMDAALTFDPQGQIWLATVQGVGVLGTDGSWKEHPLGDPYRSLTIYDVIADDKGYVWVAAFQPRSNNAEPFTGFFLFDPQTGWRNYSNRNSGLRGDVNAMALDPEGRVWIGSTQGGVSTFDLAVSLPFNILSIVRFGSKALLPGILISIALLTLAATMQVRPGTRKVNARPVSEFSFGFVIWFAVAMVVWVILRYSQQQSSIGLPFINPLVVLVPVVHIIFMITLYVKQRQMARGAISAMVVNSVGMLFVLPFGLASITTPVFAALFMMPFFLVL